MDLYQQMIIDHSKNPVGHCNQLDGCCAHGVNPLCGDKIDCCVEIENETIVKISHQAYGCSLAKASASLLAKTCEGMLIDEFNQQYKSVISVLTEGGELDGKLACFNHVHRFPMRVKCVTFPWHAARQAITQALYPVKVKQSAQVYWQQMVEQAEAKGLYLDFKQVGCYGWQYKTQLIDDQVDPSWNVYKFDGWALYMSQDTKNRVEGTIVDYTKSQDGITTKVSYTHPAAKQYCGCGDSLFIEDVK